LTFNNFLILLKKQEGIKMKRKTILLFISIVLMNFVFKAEAQTQKPVAKPDPISPPELVAPIEGAKLEMVPRKTIFEWKHVEGASKYEIEVEYSDGKWHLISNASTNLVSYTLVFPGKQPGRWRVRSFSKATGKAGVYSAWRNFTYLK
jgi:hypothetical protein